MAAVVDADAEEGDGDFERFRMKEIEPCSRHFGELDLDLRIFVIDLLGLEELASSGAQITDIEGISNLPNVKVERMMKKGRFITIP